MLGKLIVSGAVVAALLIIAVAAAPAFLAPLGAHGGDGTASSEHELDHSLADCATLSALREFSLNIGAHGMLYVAVDDYIEIECLQLSELLASGPATSTSPEGSLETAEPTAVSHRHDMCQSHYHEMVLGEYEHVHEDDGNVRYMDCDPSDGETPTPVPTATPAQAHNDFSLTVQEPRLSPTPVDLSVVDIEALSNHDLVMVNEPQIYRAISNLPWVRDGITVGSEYVGLSRLFVMLTSQRRISASISIQDWFTDGLESVESDAILAFGELSRWNEDTALYLVGSRWFVDGVEPDEVAALRMVAELAPLHVERADDAARLDWLDNGVSALDARAVALVRELTGRLSPDRVFDILEMPFMEMVDPADLGALASISQMALDHPTELDSAFGFRRIRDGIDDSETPYVGALSVEVWRGASDFKWLLVRGVGQVEDRWVELPLAGPVRLSIVRADHGYEGSMDRLEDVVRSAEEMVGRPFPTAHISLVFSPGMAAGVDYTFDGHQVSVRDIFDNELRHDSFGIMAAAVARYYWNGNAAWLDTGLAEYTAALVERPESGVLRVRSAPCGYVYDIRALESIGISTYPECERSLGERVFHDLSMSLSEGDFTLGLSRLHVLVSELGVRGDMGEVYRAFDFSPVAREGVIPRWWDRSVGYDVGRFDLSAPDPSLWSVNGVMVEDYLSFDGLVAIDRVEAGKAPGWLSMVLRYRYDYSYRDDSVNLDVVQTYEDGFPYAWDTVGAERSVAHDGMERAPAGGPFSGRALGGGPSLGAGSMTWAARSPEASYYVVDGPDAVPPAFDLEGRSARVVSVRGFLDRDPSDGHQTEVEVVFSEPVWVSGNIGVSVLGKGTLLCRNQTAQIPRIDECPTDPERAGRKLRFFYWTGEPLSKGELPFVARGDRIDRFILGRGAFIKDMDGGSVYYGFGAGEFISE